MSVIPLNIREEMDADPYYHTCARKAYLDDHMCERNPLKPWQVVEWEHALYFGKNKVQKKFAIVPLCWLTHTGPEKNKEIAVWIALNQATDEELKSISKTVDYIKEREWHNNIYGIPQMPDPEIQYEPEFTE